MLFLCMYSSLLQDTLSTQPSLHCAPVCGGSNKLKGCLPPLPPPPTSSHLHFACGSFLYPVQCTWSLRMLFIWPPFLQLLCLCHCQSCSVMCSKNGRVNFGCTLFKVATCSTEYINAVLFIRNVKGKGRIQVALYLGLLAVLHYRHSISVLYCYSRRFKCCANRYITTPGATCAVCGTLSECASVMW